MTKHDDVNVTTHKHTWNRCEQQASLSGTLARVSCSSNRWAQSQHAIRPLVDAAAAAPCLPPCLYDDVGVPVCVHRTALLPNPLSITAHATIISTSASLSIA